MTIPPISPNPFAPPPEFAGTAGYTADGRLCIGSGDQVVAIDRERISPAASGIDSTSGIGVYVEPGLLHSVDRILLSHDEQSSVERRLARRHLSTCTREDLFFPPEPPGEYVGTAGYAADGTLRIGSGDQIITIVMHDGELETMGIEKRDSIGVYLRSNRLLPGGEVILSHFRQLSFQEWQEQQASGLRWLEDRAGRQSGGPDAGPENADHGTTGTNAR